MKCRELRNHAHGDEKQWYFLGLFRLFSHNHLNIRCTCRVNVYTLDAVWHLLWAHDVCAEPVCTSWMLCNPSFECDGGWKSYMDGYEFTTDTAQDGLRSMVARNGGVYQKIYIPTGWVSRNYNLFYLNHFYDKHIHLGNRTTIRRRRVIECFLHPKVSTHAYTIKQVIYSDSAMHFPPNLEI